MIRYTNPNPTEPGDVWQVDIYPDRKVRYIDRGSRSTPDRTGANDYPDPWALMRHDVPALTDEEWNADPWAESRPPAPPVPVEPPDLYAQLQAIGAELGNWESDLHVRETPEVLAIVRASGRSFERFRHAQTGAQWLDVPFSFTPWWTARERLPRQS